MRVLLLESDAALGDFLRQVLQRESFEVVLAAAPAEAWRLSLEAACELALLDGDCEPPDTLGLLPSLRAASPAAGIILLCSGRSAQERAAALDAGADDCMLKPISVVELCARIRALLRRSRPAANAVLRVADLELDRFERRVERHGQKIGLTPKEFALLEYLMCNVDAAVPRDSILQHVWSMAGESNTNIVDVYINYLRNKLDGDFQPKLIQTVRGVGYRLTAASAA